jgi:DnaK suppressor protein
MAAAKKSKQLSESDLIKAPERDYMNENQLAFFKQRLLEIRAQLLNNADDTGQHLRENETTTDPSDRATLEEEYTLELRTRDRERKLLKKVEKSLKLIEDGEYGFCEETGEPIGIPRLLARPTATLSLEAQERRERMQKMYGE